MKTWDDYSAELHARGEVIIEKAGTTRTGDKVGICGTERVSIHPVHALLVYYRDFATMSESSFIISLKLYVPNEEWHQSITLSVVDLKEFARSYSRMFPTSRWSMQYDDAWQDEIFRRDGIQVL